LQALEEENVELLKENKGLRQEVSKLKTQLDKVQTSSFIGQSQSPLIKEVKVLNEGDQRAKKRPFGEDLGNIGSVGENIASDNLVKGRRVRSRISTKQPLTSENENPGECNQS